MSTTKITGAGIPQVTQPKPTPPPPPTDLLLPEYDPAHPWDFSVANAVAWEDVASVVHGYLQGVFSGAAHRMDTGLDPPAPGGLPGILSSLSDGGPGGVYTAFLLFVNGLIRQICDENGLSHFAQLAGSGGPPLRSVAGTSNVTWPGGTSVSNTTTIALPGASGIVDALVTANDATSSFLNCTWVAKPNGFGGIQVVFSAAPGFVPGAGTSAGFTYLMWGN